MGETKPYSIRIKGLKNWQGAATAAESPLFYFAPDSVLECIEKPVTLNEAVRLGSHKAVVGKGDFSIDFTLTTTDADVQLASQGEAWSLALKGGKLCFKAGHVAYTTPISVHDGKAHHIVCCRERNGMVKVYVDGQLQGTAYDKAYVNEPLQPAPIVLGQAGRTFTFDTFTLRDGALSFDKVGL